MRLKVALVSLVVPTVVLLGGLQGITPALADYSSHPVFQVGLSANCNNPSLCGQFLGGFWGWAVFNIDGSADAQLTGCGHLQGGGGPGPPALSTSTPTSSNGASEGTATSG